MAELRDGDSLEAAFPSGRPEAAAVIWDPLGETRPGRAEHSGRQPGRIKRAGAEPPRRAHETKDTYRSRLAEYSSVHPAQFAIELAAGTLKELNLEVQDKIALDLRRLKALAR